MSDDNGHGFRREREPAKPAGIMGEVDAVAALERRAKYKSGDAVAVVEPGTRASTPAGICADDAASAATKESELEQVCHDSPFVACRADRVGGM